MTNDLYLRVPSTAPGLVLDSDKKGLTFRKELIYANEPGEQFVKKTEDKEQTFVVDEDRLRHWEQTGNEMIRNGLMVPTPLKHTDEPEKNRGRIKRFEIDTNEQGRTALFGVVEFRDEEAAKLAASTDVSIFVPDKPVYDGFGREYKQPIRHVCFTDYPVIPGLSGFEAIAASLECGYISDQVKLAKTAHAAKNPENPLIKRLKRSTVPKEITSTQGKAKHLISRVLGRLKSVGGHSASGFVGEMKDDAQAVRSVLGQVKSHIAGKADDAIKQTAQSLVHHTRDAIRETVSQEWKNAKSAAFKKLRMPAAVAGAAGVGYLIHRLTKPKPKAKEIVAASLELSAAKKTTAKSVRKIVTEIKAPKGIVPPFKFEHMQNATAAERAAIGKRIAQIKSARGSRRLIRNGTVLGAGAVGLAILHHLQHQAALASSGMSASLELSEAVPRTAMGRFAPNPNSKSAQRNLQREARSRFAVANHGLDDQKRPSLSAATKYAEENPNNSYHANKEALASHHNLLHAINHTAQGLGHAAIVGAGLAAAIKYGHPTLKVAKKLAFTKHGQIAERLFAEHSAHSARKFIRNNALKASAALGATLVAHEGMDAHFEQAAQHIRAALSKRQKK